MREILPGHHIACHLREVPVAVLAQAAAKSGHETRCYRLRRKSVSISVLFASMAGIRRASSIRAWLYCSTTCGLVARR